MRKLKQRVLSLVLVVVMLLGMIPTTAFAANAGTEYKSEYGITVLVGDTEMDLVADGTETCGVLEAQKLNVTVPAGTTEVTFLNITDEVLWGQMYVYNGSHNWETFASNVTEATINLEECGTSFCVSDSANSWYHVNITVEEEPEQEVTKYSVVPYEMSEATLTVDKTEAAEGETVTMTLAVNEGWVFDNWFFMNSSTYKTLSLEVQDLGNNEYSFKMPACNLWAGATFKEAEQTADPYIEFTMGDATAAPGEEFTVAVTVQNELEYTEFVQMTYDLANEGVTLVSVANGKDLTGITAGTTDIMDAASPTNWAMPDNGGELLLVTYKVNEDTAAGTYDLSMDVSYLFEFVTFNDHSTKATVKKGTLTVEEPKQEVKDPAEEAQFVIKVNDVEMELVDGGTQEGCDSRFISSTVQIFNVTVPTGTTTVTVELKEGATASFANIRYMVEGADHAFGGNAMPAFEADVANYDGLCISCGGKYYHVNITEQEKAGAYQSITTDMEGDVIVTEQDEMIEGWVPYYHVVVPRGSTYAYVTYPADTIYVAGGMAHVTEFKFDGSHCPDKFWSATENADGSVTVALPIKDLITEEPGTGTAPAFWKAAGDEVLEGFTFSYAEDTTVWLVTLAAGNGYTTDGEGYVKTGEDYSFTIDIKNGYDATNMVIKVNGEAVEPDEDGVYTVTNVTADLVITVEGVEAIPNDGDVSVYFSVEKGNRFVEQGGVVWALEKVTIPYFDLALYDMEYLYYNPDCYSEGQSSQAPGTKETADGTVTLLHMLIWLTEVYYNDLDPADAGKGWLAENGWPGFNVYSATAGSAFFYMWGFGTDFNYYLNYEYPLGYPGWGATCDQLKLSDGDVVSLRYNDNSGNVGTYHHFGEKGLITKTVNKGQVFDLNLFSTGEDYANYTTPVFNVGEGHNVYLFDQSEINVDPTKGTLLDTTDEDGKVTIDTSNLELGTYYLVSDSTSPAVMLLTIEDGKQEPEEPTSVIAVTANGTAVEVVDGGTEACGPIVTAQIYNVTVPAGTTKITVEPTAENDSLTIYKGCQTWNEVGSGKSIELTVSEGVNQFDVSDSTYNWYHLNVTVEEPEYQLGDLNGDGEIDILDANLIAGYYNEVIELTDEQLAAADVNGDGIVDILDANLVSSYYNEVIDSFPVNR